MLPGTQANEDLFRPSLQEHAHPAERSPLPWRVGSQFVVAFLGGSLAVGAIAWLNARRLGVDPRRARYIPLAVGVAIALSVATVGWQLSVRHDRELVSMVRRVHQIVAVILYLFLAWIQRPADRRHQMFGGEYASLWRAGLLACLAGLAATAGLVFVGAMALSAAR